MADDFLQKRLIDLANQSYRNNVYTFTGFLSMEQQADFWSVPSGSWPVAYTLFGGGEGCERQIIRFGSLENFGYEEPFPICCVEIRPQAMKFAENIGHRDVLGSLMNIGIERATLGDIFIKEKIAYVFCHEKVSRYILENVDRIRHTSVKCRVLEEVPKVLKPELATENVIVSSARLDVIVAKLFHLSRSSSLLLFREKKIFVNGKIMENNSGILKAGDVVSVRGFGKFIYSGAGTQTKKGNLNIEVQRYV